MDAIMQICHQIIFMDEGTKVNKGTPEEVRNEPKIFEVYSA
jgi:ABC-type branched-subunit amino acid transport system ATPase component